MGKINQLDNAVDHGIPDGQQRIHGTQIDGVNHLLPKHSNTLPEKIIMGRKSVRLPHWGITFFLTVFVYKLQRYNLPCNEVKCNRRVFSGNRLNQTKYKMDISGVEASRYSKYV
jgi:hypothetical protein